MNIETTRQSLYIFDVHPPFTEGTKLSSPPSARGGLERRRGEIEIIFHLSSPSSPSSLLSFIQKIYGFILSNLNHVLLRFIFNQSH